MFYLVEVFEHGIGYVKRTHDRHRWEDKKKKKKNLRKNNKKMICSSRKTSHRQTLEG